MDEVRDCGCIVHHNRAPELRTGVYLRCPEAQDIYLKGHYRRGVQTKEDLKALGETLQDHLGLQSEEWEPDFR